MDVNAQAVAFIVSAGVSSGAFGGGKEVPVGKFHVARRGHAETTAHVLQEKEEMKLEAAGEPVCEGYTEVCVGS